MDNISYDRMIIPVVQRVYTALGVREDHMVLWSVTIGVKLPMESTDIWIAWNSA